MKAVDTDQGSDKLPTAARAAVEVVQSETPQVTVPAVEGTDEEGRALEAAAAAGGEEAGTGVAEEDRLSAALQLLGLSEGFELDGERRVGGCSGLCGSVCG